jgi:nucleoside-diphosphate-sugar epimerase
VKIAVFGSTGALGRHVVPRLIERGHQVIAVVRSADKAQALRKLGVTIAEGDVLLGEGLAKSSAGAETVMNLVTAIPRPPWTEATDWRANERVCRIGVKNVLLAARAVSAARYIQQSVVFIYGDRGHKLADESTELVPPERARCYVDMEWMVRSFPMDWVILRAGLLYGAATGLEDSWRAASRQGALRIPGDGSALVSLIQVTDLARAVVMAAEMAPGKNVFNVVDDQPVSWGELFRHIAAQSGGPEPVAGGPLGEPPLGCRNDKLKQAIGWSPSYPTYRSGLA